MVNMDEMHKLVRLLAKADIPFEIRARKLAGEYTWQICSPSCANCDVDAICFRGTMGYENGLIEIMSRKLADVRGYLTANEALSYFADYIEEWER